MAEENFTRRMKKEGDADVEFLSPMIVVDLEYFKPYSNDIELRKRVRKYLLDNFRDKVVVNSHTGKKIIITAVSIKKMTHTAGESKLRLLLHLPEILSNATPLTVEDIYKDNVNIKRISKYVYVFETYLKIEDKIYEFGFKTFVIDEEQPIHVYSGFLNVKTPI